MSPSWGRAGACIYQAVKESASKKQQDPGKAACTEVATNTFLGFYFPVAVPIFDSKEKTFSWCLSFCTWFLKPPHTSELPFASRLSCVSQDVSIFKLECEIKHHRDVSSISASTLGKRVSRILLWTKRVGSRKDHEITNALGPQQELTLPSDLMETPLRRSTCIHEISSLIPA